MAFSSNSAIRAGCSLWFLSSTNIGVPLLTNSNCVINSTRYLSRLRTKTPKRTYWFKRLAPPLFDKSLIEQKLEQRPEARFEKIAPAIPPQSSSVFYDPLVQKFTNLIMLGGQKELADRIMRKAFERIKRTQLEKYHDADDVTKSQIMLNPNVIFKAAIDNCKPVLALTPLKRGGITYQVPTAVPDHKAQWTSMKWLLLAARDHEQKNDRMWDALAREFISAYNNEGRVIKRKHDLHKQCEANKAYAHYRWSR